MATYFQLPRTGLIGWLLRVPEPRNIYPWRHHQSPPWPPFEHPHFSFYITFIFFSPFRQQWPEVWWLSLTFAALFPPLFLNQVPVKMFPGPFSSTPAPRVKSSALGATPRIFKAGFSQQHGLKTQMPAKATIQFSPYLPQPCIPQSATDKLDCRWDQFRVSVFISAPIKTIATPESMKCFRDNFLSSCPQTHRHKWVKK